VFIVISVALTSKTPYSLHMTTDQTVPSHKSQKIMTIGQWLHSLLKTYRNLYNTCFVSYKRDDSLCASLVIYGSLLTESGTFTSVRFWNVFVLLGKMLGLLVASVCLHLDPVVETVNNV